MNKFYRVMKGMFGWLYRRLWRVKIINREKEAVGTPFIVCANHASMMDGPMILVSLKSQMRCMTKIEMFRVPVLGWFIKAMGAYPIDRAKGDIAAMRQTLEILKGGESIAIFPQGTRHPYVHPKGTELKSGIGMFAERAGVGILPVCIKNKSGKVKFLRRNKLIIGDYIPPENLKFEGLSARERYQKITELAFSKVVELYDLEDQKEKAKKEKKKNKK